MPSRGFSFSRSQNRDRVIHHETNNPKGVFTGLFTGMSGPHLAAYLQTSIRDTYERYYQHGKGNDRQKVVLALKKTYDELEDSLKSAARKAGEFGFQKVVYSGATALCALVTDSFYVVANAGDSQCVLISKGEDSDMKATELCSIHSLLNPEEAEKFRKAHRREAEESENVLGRTNVTRGFGMLDLKYREFDNPWGFGEEGGFRKSREKFKGPYVTHKPDVIVRDIHPSDIFLVLGSRAFWSILSAQEAAIILESISDPQEAADKLLLLAKKRQSKSILIRPPHTPPEVINDISVLVVKVKSE